ncbi:alpha-amylase [Ectothiorhodospiraceae bacterium 2226]|nr:alpha-amylase [Ectothiorhodospiraceae bacterium 2226]
MLQGTAVRRGGSGIWLLVMMVVAALAVPASAAAEAAAPITLDTHGGDTWTFSQTITGQVRGEACAQVMVRAPRGVVAAAREGARFAAEVALREGENAVQAVCLDASEAVAARSEVATWTVRAPDVPVARVAVRAGEDVVALDASGSDEAPGEAAPLVGYAWAARADNPAPLLVAGDVRGLPVERDTDAALHVELPTVDGEYFVTLRVTDARGRSDESTAVFVVEDGAARAVDLAVWAPGWVDEAVVYGAVPYFLGGGFEDVRAHLDDIAALGVTTLWLSPVSEPAPDDFGYAVRDHFAARADYGGEAALRALIADAQARGLRVLLDFVPSHLSDRHPYHLDAARHGRRSPYHAWFDRDPVGEITHYFDWYNLKNLDYDNPEVRAYVIAAAAHWLRAYGIDGFRVDASWAVSDRAPGFWAAFRAELKRIDPDILLLAEASARAPPHRAHFDAWYDWTGRLGQWAWDEAFADGAVELARLRAALTHPAVPPAAAARTLRFLNNNDTGARFISRHGLALTRVAAALTFTLPGIPLVYTGDEVGAEFEPYGPRPPIDWDDPRALRPYYARLAATRASLPALRGAALQVPAHDQDDAVLVFLRPAVKGSEAALVALNFSGEALAVTVDGVDLADAHPISLAGDADGVVLDGATLHLPAYGAAVLRGRF